MTYDQFLRAVAPLLDLDWRKYRRRMARRAVLARVAELGLTDLSAYLARLRADPVEARLLPDRMRVTVTRFLRERERWEGLFARVVPELVAGRDRLRVWSAGCCGGEEPYTFSLLWAERIAPRCPALELSILATDIDPASLTRAARAVYDGGSLREVPAPECAAWFVADGRRWRVRDAGRAPVYFQRHNLLTGPLPAEVDLVLCRYLAFTYYRGERRAAATRRLYSALRPGGALMIGRKEGLTPADRRLFAPWPGVAGVFHRQMHG